MRLVYKHLLIICLNFACFYRSLDGDFVFDDSVAIVKNRDVYEGRLDRGTFESIFVRNDFWGNNLTKKDSHKSYRPLTTLSFLLERTLHGGLDSSSMKVSNLVVHTSNCCLLLHFLQAILNDRRLAFIATILFCVHPVHTEAVCGIVSRSDLMACLVFLLSGILYARVFHKDKTFNVKTCHSITFTLIIGLMSFVGILFKENAITIMPTLAALDLIRNARHLKDLPKKLFLRFALLLGLTIAIVYFRLWVQDFSTPNFRPEDNPVAAIDEILLKLVNQSYLYALNTFLLLMPEWLSFDWSFDSIRLIQDLGDARVWLVLLFYFVLCTLAVRGVWKRNLLIALVLMVVPFSPALGFIKLGFVIAERILYIPSIGFATLIAIGLKSLLRIHRSLPYAALCLLVASHCAKTHQRSLEWRTEHELFASALRVVPNNAKVFYNIARISSEKRDIETAARYYRHAIKLHPTYESAHMNLGNLYRELNDFGRAKFHLTRAVEILEEFPTAWMNLGIVQAVLKDYEAAERSYLKALSYRKNYANCYYNMGNLYIDMKNATAAIEHWKIAIAISPTHRKAWSNILAFYDNQRNNHENVLKYSEIALAYLPNDTNILFSRANTFGKLAQYEEAEKIFKQIIEAEPKKSIFYANLGVLYHRWGKKELAKRNYEIALSLDSSLKNAHENLMKLRGG